MGKRMRKTHEGKAKGRRVKKKAAAKNEREEELH
jgi:hypothetical protein